MFGQTYRAGAKGSESERDTVICYQDFEKNQNVRRLCSRNQASHPGKWSKGNSPAREPVVSIEWKAKQSVNKTEIDEGTVKPE